jgi:hypothetical protein
VPGAPGLAVRGARAATVAAVAAGAPGLGVRGARAATVAAVAAGAPGLGVRGARAATVAAVAAGAPGLAVRGARAATVEAVAAGTPWTARGPGATRAPAEGPVAAHAVRLAVARLAAGEPGIAARRRVAAAPAMRRGAVPAGETTRTPTGGVPDRGVVRPGGVPGVTTTESMTPPPSVRPSGRRRAGLGADRRTGQHARPAGMTTASPGIAASARIAGRHRGTAAHGTSAIAAPVAARAGTGNRKPDAVISVGQGGRVPAGRLTAVTLIAVAYREPDSGIAVMAATETGPSAGPASAPGGSLTAAALSGAAGPVIAVLADTGRIGPATAALAGTCPNASAAPSQMSGRIGTAAPLAVPGRSAATTGATAAGVTVTVGTAVGTGLKVAVTGPRVVRGVRVAQDHARRSQGRQAGPAGQYGQGARGSRGARSGRLGSVPVRARAATATVRTAAGATVAGVTVAGVTVMGPHRPRRAFRIALPRTRFLAR